MNINGSIRDFFDAGSNFKNEIYYSYYAENNKLNFYISKQFDIKNENNEIIQHYKIQ